MKIQTKITIAVGILLLIGLTAGGYFWGRNTILRKQIKLVEKLNAEKLRAKDFELEMLAEKITDGTERIAELKKDVTKIEKERDKNKEEVERLKKKIEDAPPETLLAESRRILNTREIWLIDKAMGRFDEGVSTKMIEEFAAGAEFSMTAFRVATWIFTDWENFTLVREPNYLQRIENYRQITTTQALLVSDWRISSGLWQEKYYILDNTFSEWKQFVSKKKNIFSWLGDKALTFAIGYFVGNFAEKIF